MACEDRCPYWIPVVYDWFEKRDPQGAVYASIRYENCGETDPRTGWLWTVFVDGEELGSGRPKASAIETMDDYDRMLGRAEPWLAEIIPTGYVVLGQ